MNQKKIRKAAAGCLLVIFCGVFYLTANVGNGTDEVVTEPFSDGSNPISTGSVKEVRGENPEEAPEPDSTDAAVYIHICGAVNKPGVYIFDREPRVIEVVEKAGGFTEKADQTSLNLAELVSDGAKLDVAVKGGKEKQQNPKKAVSGSPDSGKVNINTATKEELMTLNGIGESKAAQIISYRESAGSFQKIEDIKNISGIKEGIFSKIKDMITVSE